MTPRYVRVDEPVRSFYFLRSRTAGFFFILASRLSISRLKTTWEVLPHKEERDICTVYTVHTLQCLQQFKVMRYDMRALTHYSATNTE